MNEKGRGRRGGGGRRKRKKKNYEKKKRKRKKGLVEIFAKKNLAKELLALRIPLRDFFLQKKSRMLPSSSLS